MLNKLRNYRIYTKFREQLLFSCDIVMVTLAYLTADLLKNNFSINKNILDPKQLIVFVSLIIVIYMLCFYIFKIYKSLWKHIGLDELLNLTFANGLATFILLLIAYFRFGSMILSSFIIIAGILSLFFMSAFRVAYRVNRRFEISKKAIAKKRVIIIGAGDAGNLLLREIKQNTELNYEVVGFVDDYKENIIISGKYRILGTTQDLSLLKEKYNVDVALIAITKIKHSELARIYDLCENTKLETKVVNFNLSDDMVSKTSIKDVKIEDLLGRGEIALDQSEISSYLADKVVAVTGAGGSIGSELCRQIIKFGPRKLIMIDISENYLYMLEQEFKRELEHSRISHNIEFKSLIASIRDKDAIDSIFKRYRPEVVYHAAAHKHVPLMESRPVEAVKNNIFGTHNVILSCIENKVNKFIMISTDKAVNPTNVMGATKRMTEMILQAYGNNGVTKMAAVRFGNVLGSNGSVIPIFKEQIAEGGPVTITSKEIIRYFMTIPEAAQLVLQAGYYADKGDIFVLDMGEPVKIIDLAERMIKLSGFKPYEDIEIKEIGLRPGEKMFEELHLDNEDTTKTKNNLIYKNAAIYLEQGILVDLLSQLKEYIESGNDDSHSLKAMLLEMIKIN